MFVDVHVRWYDLGITRFEFLSVLVFILVLEGVHYLQRKGSVRELLAKQHWIVRWIVYISLVFIIFNFGEFGEKEFIYFDF